MKRKRWVAVFLSLVLILSMGSPVSAKGYSKNSNNSGNKYSWSQTNEKSSANKKETSTNEDVSDNETTSDDSIVDETTGSVDEIAAEDEVSEEETVTDSETVVEGTPEETVPTQEPDPEDVPTYMEGSMTGNDGVYTVTVNVGTDAQIPEGSSVSVKELTEEDEAYQQAKEQVQVSEEDGFAALDISILDAEGNEIEPAAAVEVEIQMSQLPENVDADTEITVSHIDESTGTAVVQTVADTADETEGTVEVTEDAVVVNFAVDSFSTFAIQYTSASAENEGAETDNADYSNTTEISTEVSNSTKNGTSVTEEPVDVPENSIVLQDVTDGEGVTVSVEGVANLTKREISLGTLDASNESLTIEGYDFIRAQIGSGDDYTTITGLYKIEDSDDYYATIEGNETTGMRISDTTTVTLVYETHRDTYNVTYVIQVDGEAVTENTDSIVAITGASTVKSGSNLEFVAMVQDGYTLLNVPSSTSGIVSAGENNIYTVTGISSDTTITLSLSEITQYTMSFSGSNTILTYNGQSYASAHNNSGQIIRDWVYTPAEKIEFTLVGQNEWNSSTRTKILNQLSITVDDVSTAAEIPDSQGEKVVTTIAKGYEVTVTKTSNGTFPQYSVEITNPIDGGKVRGTIHIQTNYKDYNSSEVWAKQLDGVEPLAYTKYTSGSYYPNIITNDGQGDQNSRLQPEEYTFYSRNTSRSSTYYIKLTGQYNAEDLYLTVVSYGVVSAGGDAELQYTIFDGVPVSNLDTAMLTGYDYQFEISADTNRIKYTDIRIYIQYRPQTDAEYTITYDTDGGSDIAANSGTYHVGDSAVLTETIPTKTGFVFDGWYLERDPENLYDSGKLFTITENNIAYANSDDEFVFKAKWTSATNATYAPFTVQVFFQTQDENGNLIYPDKADIVTSEHGRVGSFAYIIPSALQNVLDAQKPGWSDDYEYAYQETDDAISPNGTTVLTIYYKLKVFQVYHTGVEGGNVETITMSSLKDGTYDLTQNLTTNTLYGGYYLGYEPDKSGAAYDGTNATWSEAQTENGMAMHPEAGETYYVKEVPDTYLHPATYIVYDKIDNNQIVQLYLITATDDQNYRSAGFDVTLNGITVGDNENSNSEVVAASLFGQVTVKKDGQDDQTLNAKTVFSDLKSGYLAISANKLEYIVPNANYVEKPYWVTRDGVKVTGNQNLKVYLRNTTYKEGWKLPGITKTAQTAVPTVTYVGTGE